MKKIREKILIYTLIPLALICIGFVILLGNTPSVKTPVPQKINLALRQTAHRLLQEAGDSTSTIAPIQQTNDNVYVVKLEHAFNYDTLPIFLQNSFKEHGIQGQYDVAIWDCDYKALILGYSSFDVEKNKNVPCSGRQQTGVNCFNFTVTFTQTSPFLVENASFWFILGGLSALCLATVGYFFYFYANKKQKNVASNTDFNTDLNTPSNAVEPSETHLIYIGKTIFDTHNQTLTTEGNTQKLTEKESKLLELFSKNQNILLDRDLILKEIWADEGVLVTRSVDVFVSRLRKLLKDDASLKIANVHSRGYRFETSDT